MNHLLLAIAAVFAPDSLPPLSSLPAARVTVLERRDEIVIEMPPIDLPAGLAHEHGHDGGHDHGDPMAAVRPGFPPVSLVTMPVSGAIYGFRVEMVDSAGQPLPSVLLHHLNFIDPFHRELFLPISRRMIAAGKETGSQDLPWLLFGLPVREGQQLVINGMLHNPTTTSYRQVRTRLVLNFTRASRPWPFFSVFPWQLDVLFPVGDKSFDLPPGKSVMSYEARPALAGKVVAVGGHVHEHAVRISFIDATTGQVLWEGAPRVDSAGTVTGVPVGRLYRWNRIGAPITPDHVYRVTVEYNNPTGQVIPAGGMGVIGGLFAPDEPEQWPAAVRTDSLYLMDMGHYLQRWQGRKDDRASVRKPAAGAMSGHH
jgi:hypothetical protein